MGRLHHGLLRRAMAVLCMAVWLMASCPGMAQSDNSSDEAQAARADESARVSIKSDLLMDAVNPMQAIDVVGYFGATSHIAPSTLLSIGTDAVVNGSTYVPRTEEEYIRLQLQQSRQRIQALSVAGAMDDQSSGEQRFGSFPDQYLMEAPSLRAAETPVADKQPAAATGKTVPTNPSKPKQAAPAKQPQSSGSAKPRVEATVKAPEQSITEVLAQLSAAEQDAEDRRILAALLAENPEAAAGSVELATTEPELEAVVAEPTASESAIGFNGLIDFSPAAEESTDEAGKQPAPGGFLGKFGFKMAIFTVGLLFLASFLKTKGNPLAKLHKRNIKVLETVSLGPGRQIVIVEMQNSHLVLGVTNGSINLLDRLPGEALGEQYRDTVQDIIQRESVTDNADWKKRPVLNLMDSGRIQPTAPDGREGYSHRISVSDLRRARGNPDGKLETPKTNDNDSRSHLISKVRSQLERIQG